MLRTLVKTHLQSETMHTIKKIQDWLLGKVRRNHQVAIALGEKPYGTTHWAGTWNGHPALALAYWGGATLFYFDKEWKEIPFSNLADLYDELGVTP